MAPQAGIEQVHTPAQVPYRQAGPIWLEVKGCHTVQVFDLQHELHLTGQPCDVYSLTTQLALSIADRIFCIALPAACKYDWHHELHLSLLCCNVCSLAYTAGITALVSVCLGPRNTEGLTGVAVVYVVLLRGIGTF